MLLISRKAERDRSIVQFRGTEVVWEPPLRNAIGYLEMCVYKCWFRDRSCNVRNLQGRTFDFKLGKFDRN